MEIELDTNQKNDTTPQQENEVKDTPTNEMKIKQANNTKDQSEEDKNNKKARIFIKNLVFDINERLIRKQFSKYGKIQEINIPVNPSTNRSQGYAFVQYTNVNMARKAIKEMDQKIYKGRKLQIQFAVDQRIYRKPVQNNGLQDVKEQNKQNVNETTVNVDTKQQVESEQKEQQTKQAEEEQEVKQIEEEQEIKKTKNKKKDYENEDKKAIIFIKNIDYECDEQELKNNFQKAGKVISAKLVKMRGAEKHKGSGFVKFLEQDVAQNILKSYQQIKQNPEQKSILDPLNILTLYNRNLEILPCMDSSTLKTKIDLQQQKEKQLKFKLSQGLPVLEHNIEQDNFSKQQIQNRRRHFDEKMLKLQNNNYQMSATKVLLKNINKNLDKKFFQNFGFKVLEDFYLTKILRKKKIFKDINLMGSKQNQQNRGLVILNYFNSKFADQFMQGIKQEKYWKQLQRNENEIPIIEYIFEDMQKLKRRNDIIEKIQQKQNNKNDVVNEIQKRNKKIAKKQKYNDLKKEVKILYEQSVKSNNLKDAQICLNKLSEFKSRGIKKRMKKNLKKAFPQLNIQD